MVKELPASLEKIISNIVRDAKDQDDCLRKCFLAVIDRQQGGRIGLITHLRSVCSHDLVLAWKKKYHHCTVANYLLTTMLLETKFFKEEDVKKRWTTTLFFIPHQYLQVRTGKSWLNVDPWAYRFGIELGDYNHGSHIGYWKHIR